MTHHEFGESREPTQSGHHRFQRRMGGNRGVTDIPVPPPDVPPGLEPRRSVGAMGTERFGRTELMQGDQIAESVIGPDGQIGFTSFGYLAEPDEIPFKSETEKQELNTALRRTFNSSYRNGGQGIDGRPRDIHLLKETRDQLGLPDNELSVPLVAIRAQQLGWVNWQEGQAEDAEVISSFWLTQLVEPQARETLAQLFPDDETFVPLSNAAQTDGSIRSLFPIARRLGITDNEQFALTVKQLGLVIDRNPLLQQVFTDRNELTDAYVERVTPLLNQLTPAEAQALTANALPEDQEWISEGRRRSDVIAEIQQKTVPVASHEPITDVPHQSLSEVRARLLEEAANRPLVPEPEPVKPPQRAPDIVVEQEAVDMPITDFPVDNPQQIIDEPTIPNQDHIFAAVEHQGAESSATAIPPQADVIPEETDMHEQVGNASDIVSEPVPEDATEGKIVVLGEENLVQDTTSESNSRKPNRSKRALELHREGKSDVEIAEIFGSTEELARQYVRRGLNTEAGGVRSEKKRKDDAFVASHIENLGMALPQSREEMTELAEEIAEMRKISPAIARSYVNRHVARKMYLNAQENNSPFHLEDVRNLTGVTLRRASGYLEIFGREHVNDRRVRSIHERIDEVGRLVKEEKMSPEDAYHRVMGTTPDQPVHNRHRHTQLMVEKGIVPEGFTWRAPSRETVPATDATNIDRLAVLLDNGLDLEGAMTRLELSPKSYGYYRNEFIALGYDIPEREQARPGTVSPVLSKLVELTGNGLPLVSAMEAEDIPIEKYRYYYKQVTLKGVDLTGQNPEVVTTAKLADLLRAGKTLDVAVADLKLSEGSYNRYRSHLIKQGFDVPKQPIKVEKKYSPKLIAVKSHLAKGLSLKDSLAAERIPVNKKSLYYYRQKLKEESKLPVEAQAKHDTKNVDYAVSIAAHIEEHGGTMDAAIAALGITFTNRNQRNVVKGHLMKLKVPEEKLAKQKRDSTKAEDNPIAAAPSEKPESKPKTTARRTQPESKYVAPARRVAAHIKEHGGTMYDALEALDITMAEPVDRYRLKKTLSKLGVSKDLLEKRGNNSLAPAIQIAAHIKEHGGDMDAAIASLGITLANRHHRYEVKKRLLKLGVSQDKLGKLPKGPVKKEPSKLDKLEGFIRAGKSFEAAAAEANVTDNDNSRRAYRSHLRKRGVDVPLNSRKGRRSEHSFSAKLDKVQRHMIENNVTNVEEAFTSLSLPVPDLAKLAKAERILRRRGVPIPVTETPVLEEEIVTTEPSVEQSTQSMHLSTPQVTQTEMLGRQEAREELVTTIYASGTTDPHDIVEAMREEGVFATERVVNGILHVTGMLDDEDETEEQGPEPRDLGAAANRGRRNLFSYKPRDN